MAKKGCFLAHSACKPYFFGVFFRSVETQNKDPNRTHFSEKVVKKGVKLQYLP